MTNGYNYKKLGQLGSIITGKTPPSQDKRYYQSSEIAFITPTDYKSDNRYISPSRFLSECVKNDFPSIVIPPEAIMVTCIGSDMGKVAMSNTICVTNQQINTIIPNKEIIDSEYLYYSLLSKHETLRKLAEGSGSTMPIINKSDFSNIEISLPPLSEQHRIANILSSFDNKIELLRKENNTLEDIAQSIFKEWFVKYNFPNKDGKPYRDNNGKMIDSELGLIPEGWRVGKLGEFGKIVCGKTPPKNIPEYFNGKYPFIKIPDMQDMFIVRSEDSLTELGARQLSGKLLPSGSICVSCIATIGKVSITTQDSFTNQQINTIIPKEGTLEYLYFTLSNMKGYLEQIGNRGSTTFNINTNMFATLDILAPEYNILIIFNQICDKIFKKIASNNKVLLNLIQQKAISLHKLIN